MKKSFTLIELLISIVLLSLLISSSMIAFKFFLNKSSLIQEKIPKKAMVYSWIEKSLSGLYPYTLKNFKYFFYCNEYELSYITSTPIIYNEMAVAKIIYKNKRLYYYESPLFFKFQDYLDPKILDSNYSKILLFNNVNNFKIICPKIFGKYIFKIDKDTFIFNVFSNWKDLNFSLKERTTIE